MSILTLLGLLAIAPPPEPPTRRADPAVTISIDSSRRELTLRAGPFTIPGNHGDPAHGGHGSHDAPGAQTPFLTFDWPLTGWLYAFTLTLTDAQGRPLPRTLIHHVNMIHLERRALLYDAVERTMAAGSETEDVALPRSIGFPMEAGAAMGIVAAWANTTHADIEGVHLAVTYRWSPANLSPRPTSVLPLWLDVNYQGAGQSDSYDLPPGRSVRSFEFTMPIEGRLLGAGGHLHDHAIDVRLEEVESGREVVRLRANLGAGGKIEAVERKLFGVQGDGIRLREGRRYRVVAAYDNPTGATIPNGAMGIILGLFAPSDLRRWPRADPSIPGIRADLAAIMAGPTAARERQQP